MLVSDFVFVCAALTQEPLQSIDFQRDVRPILSDKCFACHGPDAAARKADLRLDTREGALADLGGYVAVVPGGAEESELIYRITSEDRRELMPPPESGHSLTDEERATLRAWVDQGAEYAPHWSFVPVDSVLSPAVTEEWARDEIDSYVLHRMKMAGLDPQRDAVDEDWLRRVSFVLTGLPPTMELITGFPSELTRGQVVDQLLGSPHFGEHFAAQWMDIARYADTYGYQNDRERRVWPYRDWVIRAYNENLPYDDFVRWQLAGDMLPDPTLEQRIATAFQRLHRQTNEGGSVEEEFRVEYVSDRVHTMGTAFLGLTFECARCHDHRYDPISQVEYYQLSDYFDDIKESGLYSHFTNATPTPAMELPSERQSIAMADAEAAVAAAEAKLSEVLQDQHGLARVVPSDDVEVLFDFDTWSEDQVSLGVGAENAAARMEGFFKKVDGVRGSGIRLNGDEGIRFSGVGAWRRSDPFTVSMWLKLDGPIERAVLLHRSRAWHDAASQGWQLLIEDGRLTAALVHFWPGDMAMVRTFDPLPIGEWIEVQLAYDGSSNAYGMALSVNGESARVTVGENSLTRAIVGGGPGDPSFGARFRDRGFSQGVLDEVRFISGWPGPSWDPAVDLARADLRNARRNRDELRDEIPQLMVMRERAQPRASRFLDRGLYDSPKGPVGRAVPTALLGDVDQPKNRLELANWMLNRDHPLTARVEVDRLWRAVFGKGLMRTPENWGSQGELPTHPKLLDRLALDLMESGWDRKAMLRRIVLSRTFAQARVAFDDPSRAVDPESRYWSYYPDRRLTAEMVRDGALAHSGLLVRKIGGASVKPYQPAGLWQEKSGQVYHPSKGEGLYRRSLYTFWKRTSPPPSMMIFDAAKRDVCVVKRQETQTPLQVLVSWNDPQLVEASRMLATRMLRDSISLEKLGIELGFGPDHILSSLSAFFESEREAFAADLESASALLGVGDTPMPEDIDLAELAAMTIVCSTILSSDLYLLLP
ncbi:MAG: DUF1553 domain-containing protein [Planctomycetes bacterium]|nr:DUF1553 domain-containing protein [Planctomycetota bacterium]